MPGSSARGGGDDTGTSCTWALALTGETELAGAGEASGHDDVLALSSSAAVGPETDGTGGVGFAPSLTCTRAGTSPWTVAGGGV